MNVKQIVSASVAVASACAMFACVAPSAISAEENAVVSSRSFPKVAVAKKQLFAESTSTSVDKDSEWGGIESLDVPQTESQAQKDEKQAKKAEEEAAASQAQEQAQAQAASRSAQRSEIPQVDLGSMSGSGADLSRYATQFQGYPYLAGGNTPAGWDCSGFVQYVFAQFGISLPHSSGLQAGVGTAVGSLAEAQPGDIIANASHAAIYIGNGMVINAMNPAQGTQVSSVSVFAGGYSIRRVL